jgi:hypothetical protein
MSLSSIRSLISIGCLVWVPAFALSVAPESQLLCAGSHFVEAKVESAQVAPEPCIGAQWAASTCACRGEISVRVSKVIGVRSSVADYPEDVGISVDSIAHLLCMRQVWPPESDGAMTCARMRSELLAEPQLISIGTFYGH